ncbi:kinesin-like protein KIF20B isoform X2 [Portunus trituberculatus]|uniref:kinesin-like protein KIF20B isoform X2 n=1 Tax=Portunus trituberculatus TaxID=210409 RepID=UPI001E1D10F6|nr:kinesin-like protein KIF20B isoform X2 [Portunus trituberculatus]
MDKHTMSFMRHRSSAASHHDRLSYIHGPDQSYSTECLYTFDPRKNLNDLFQSVSMENVCMENLRVYLRVRPRLEGEVQQNEDTQVDIIDDRSVILTAPTCSNTFKNSVRGISKLTHKFTFTHVYGPSTTQEDLFRSSSLNLVTDFVSGQNCLLFTYGATNSGKTFTVQGTPEDAGLLPRTVQHIFNLVGENHYPRNDLKPKFCCKVTRLEEQDVIKEEEKRESIFKIPSNLTTTFSQSTLSILKASMSEDSVNTTECSTASHNTTEAGVSPVLDSTNDTTGDLTGLGTTLYAVFVSFAEIYNEYIFDLLEKIPMSKGKRNPLMLGEDYDGAVYIKGLNEVRVRTAEEALQLVNIGRQNLHFAATRLNHNSSRSHCIFTVKLVRLADADNPHFARVSVMSLCDLAGAERAAKTCSTQDRLKESGNINTSLLTLSRCIEALRCNQTQKGSKKVPVPYRDSKLTRLFQSFLLGKGRAAMIVNISKMPLLFDETLQVLKFSAVAKQVAITQARESEMQVVQPSRRVSRLSKMVRQSLKGNGRLSVPWAKGKGSITFGESVCEEKGDKEQEIEQEDLLEEDEDDDEEDERIEGLIQLINKLKEELVREHQEKLDLEERLRRELCKEFSQQLVEIQNSWSQRLKDQENLYEELTECKIQALMKSVKKCNKRMRCEEDPDEEYVSSVFLFREQQKVAQQKQEIEELKANENLLKEEVKSLKDSQKKINEMATQAKEEKSRLTFRLAQLTTTYDKVVQELEEAKSLSVSASLDNTEVIQELRAQLEKRSAQLAEQDHEIQDLQTMLVEASEYCTSKEDLCSNLEKLLESSRLKNTQHMMYINDVESQLEESRSMLSQQAAQMEEREQDIEDLRQLLSQERKSRKEELSKMEEDYVREKSKLLLEVAGLKRNKPAENSGNGEEVKVLAEKVSQLQEEKEALKKSSESVRERQEQETIEKDKHIKSLEEELVMMKKQLSQKETDIKKEKEEKEIKIDELKKIQESVLHQEELKGEKVAEIDRLMQDNEALSSQVQCLKACNEALNSECEDIKSCLKEKKDAEVKLQEDFTACNSKLEELEKAYGSLKKMEDAKVKLQEDLDKSTAEVQELVKANISLKEQVNAKAEMEELQRAHTLLKKEIDAKTELQENLNTCQMQLEALQTTHTSLEEEKEALRQKLQDQTNLLEKLKAESEAEAGKNSAMCEKLRAEIEELKMMKVGQDNAVQEVSELKVRLEAQVEQIKEEKSQVQIQVEMLELDKKKMGERLHNLQEASHLKGQQAQIEIETLHEQIEILMKDKIALEAKVEAAQRQTQEQISLVQQKQEVMQALSSKIESLDAKLNRAEEEKEDKKQLEEEVKASKAKIIRLDTKCELLEKEVLALREARQAEVQESFNRTKDHEEFARQKEAEISTLQQEVKKLLQQSMCSSRSSIADPPPVKAEVAGLSDEMLNLKEELRLAVAHNSTLKEEVSSLRDQVARQSTSSDVRVLQVSSSKPSQTNRRDASTSDKEGFVTPVPKERKGRRGRPATQTSNISACLDSSVGDERQSYASPVISSPPPAPTSSSGRPQRTTRRTMRYDSEEYVLGYRPRGDDDRAWEPRLKGSGRTKPHKSKVSGVSNPSCKTKRIKAVWPTKQT